MLQKETISDKLRPKITCLYICYINKFWKQSLEWIKKTQYHTKIEEKKIPKIPTDILSLPSILIGPIEPRLCNAWEVEELRL